MLVTLEGDITNAKESSKTFYAFLCIFVSKNKVARLREDKNIEIYNTDLDSTS